MHTAHRILLLALALAGWAAAATPTKAPINKYTNLWKNSPFTSKPPPPEAGPVVNPLENYALSGVSPIGGDRYRVTMIDKKNPAERIIVETGKKSDYEIIAVNRKSGDPLGTVVRMKAGGSVGTVAFEEKLLVIAPTASAAPRGNPALPPGLAPKAANIPGQAPTRQPRPRVVPPPPTTQAQQQAKPASSNNTRPERRNR